MKAKFIEDVLLEKFVEDSDPIKDMGIGAKTKYRIRKRPGCYGILEYMVLKKSIFGLGKFVEKWYPVPLPLSPDNKKQKNNDENYLDYHAHYYYITEGHGYSSFSPKEFIKKWPRIEDYLKWVDEREAQLKRQHLDQKRREKEGDIEYLN